MRKWRHEEIEALARGYPASKGQIRDPSPGSLLPEPLPLPSHSHPASGSGHGPSEAFPLRGGHGYCPAVPTIHLKGNTNLLDTTVPARALESKALTFAVSLGLALQACFFTWKMGMTTGPTSQVGWDDQGQRGLSVMPGTQVAPLLLCIVITVLIAVAIIAINKAPSRQRDTKHREEKRQGCCVSALSLAPSGPEPGNCPGLRHPSKNVFPGLAKPRGRKWGLRDPILQTLGVCLHQVGPEEQEDL